MTRDGDESARLIGWLPHLVRAPGREQEPWGVTAWERTFAISLRARHKAKPGLRLSPRQIATLRPLVDRFVRGSLGPETGQEEGEVVERAPVQVPTQPFPAREGLS